MYHHLCLLIAISCYTSIILGICKILSKIVCPDKVVIIKDGQTSRQFYLYFGFLGIIFYPVILEILINLKACLLMKGNNSKDEHEKKHKCFTNKLPIIYHPDYNITACGLERLHPFDSVKYGRVFNILEKEKLIDLSNIHSPELPSREILLDVMSPFYLLWLHYSVYISRCVEVPICFVPSEFLRYRLLNPMMLATKGTIDGACLALEYGWAINLSGGYHHATRTGGGGFCIYPDITFAVNFLRKWHGDHVNKIMIIDLDAHQGNGHERDSIGDTNIFILDVFNNYIYPGDSYAKTAIGEEIHVKYRDSDEEYLEKVKRGIESSLSKFSPDFIIYNAGTDCMQGDPLGNLNISNQGIIQRDEIVFSFAINNRIPILMVLSGGYQQINAPTIASSIENLITKFNLLNMRSENRV